MFELSDGSDVDDPKIRDEIIGEAYQKAGPFVPTPNVEKFDPWKQCPNCDSYRVYGNGQDARELACPDCGLQYNPENEIEVRPFL